MTALLALAFCGACVQDMTDAKVEFGTESDKIVNSSDKANRGSILVRFTTEAESRLSEVATRSGATRTGVFGVDALLDEVNGYSVAPVFVVTEKNKEKVHAMGLHLWYELYFDEECDLDTVASRLSEVAEVEVVQFSEEIKRVAEPRRIERSATTLSTRATPQSKISFNDPRCHYQWHYDNQGYGKCAVTGSVNTGGISASKAVAGADINVVAAWKLCTGDPSIIVAVNDEGVYYEHEDLRANMWINRGEIPGDGVDNDNNGYVDDVYGYNFSADTSAKGKISWNKSGDTGHGSHVAGTVAAVNNNGIGVCGVAGGSGNGDGVRIMSTQIYSGRYNSSSGNIAKSIQYAADNGAVIMQCSWGYEGGTITNDSHYAQLKKVEKDAIEYFIANAGGEGSPIKGGLLIFASGNECYPMPGYPGAYKKCVSVTSFAPSLKPAYYTNYGPGADIAAPGGDQLYGDEGGVLSTTPKISGISADLYCYMQGTSMACPHVSGVAALGLAYAKKLGKSFTADEFRSMLLTSVNDINPYMSGKMTLRDGNGVISLNFANYANQMGSGYVDALKLLLQVEGTPYVSVVANQQSKIDLKPYFANGTSAIKVKSVTISDADREALGITEATVNSDCTLTFKCSKVGSANVTIEAMVGGENINESSKPAGVAVTKKVVVMSRANASTTNGWL